MCKFNLNKTATKLRWPISSADDHSTPQQRLGLFSLLEILPFDAHRRGLGRRCFWKLGVQFKGCRSLACLQSLDPELLHPAPAQLCPLLTVLGAVCVSLWPPSPSWGDEKTRSSLIGDSALCLLG